MTLRQLIEIIVEEVEKVEKHALRNARQQEILSRQKVAAVAFNPANRAALMEAARVINGKADCFHADEAADINSGYDALFLDEIPVECLAGIALGAPDAPCGSLVHGMLCRGKPVFALCRTHLPPGMNAGYRALFEGYLAALERYGVVFLDEAPPPPLVPPTFAPPSPPPPLQAGVVVPPQPPAADVYRGNVLSRGELLRNARGGRLFIGQGVVVTALALDAADALGIEIVRTDRR